MTKTRKQLEEEVDDLKKRVHDLDKHYFTLLTMYTDIQKQFCKNDQKEKTKTIDINAQVAMDSWPYGYPKNVKIQIKPD